MPKGSTIGAYAYISKKEPVCKYTAEKTIVTGRHIPQKALDKLIEKRAGIKVAVTKLAGMELINAKYYKFFNKTHQMNDQVIKIMISESDVIYGEVGTEVHLVNSFLLLLSGELSGEVLGTVCPVSDLTKTASAPQLVATASLVKWSKAGCALKLKHERAKYVYNLEGTMRSNRFTKMRVLQAWQLESEIKEQEFSAEFDNVSSEDKDEGLFENL